MAQTNITLSPTDLEDLVRRVVREELARLVRARRRIGEDLRHEGAEDVAGDEAILAEAIEVLEAYGDDPGAWLDWQEVKAELSRAKAAGELPD